MDEAVSADSETEANDVEATLGEMFAQMEQIREYMRKDQEEIEHLKAHTRGIAVETRKILDSLKAIA